MSGVEARSIEARGIEAHSITVTLQVAIQVQLADHKAKEPLNFEEGFLRHCQAFSFHLRWYRYHLPRRCARQT